MEAHLERLERNIAVNDIVMSTEKRRRANLNYNTLVPKGNEGEAGEAGLLDLFV